MTMMGIAGQNGSLVAPNRRIVLQLRGLPANTIVANLTMPM